MSNFPTASNTDQGVNASDGASATISELQQMYVGAEEGTDNAPGQSGDNNSHFSQTDTSRRSMSAINHNSALAVSPFASVNKKKTTVKAKKGRRVAIKKSSLLQITQDADQRAKIPLEFPHSAWFYGKLIGGNSAKGWEVSIDIFPAEKKTVSPVKKSCFICLDKDDDEPAFNYNQYMEGERLGEVDMDEADPSNKKISALKKSYDDFDLLDPEVRAKEKEFNLYWKDGPTPSDPVKFDIVPEGVAVKGHEFDLDAAVTICQDFKIKEYQNPNSPTEKEKVQEGSYHANFFKHVMPSITGHAKLIDEYHESHKSPQYQTVKSKKIKFHDENAEDQDHIVKKCYTLLIAGASFIQNGVNSLFKRGPSGGLSGSYPDFGKYISKSVFQAFICAAPFCWCDKKYWYLPPDQATWNIFEPVLRSFNDSRKALILTVTILILDESMSGWIPKTTKLGGLPNISFEPRKPVSLGTLFRNGVEAITKIIRYQDIQVT